MSNFHHKRLNTLGDLFNMMGGEVLKVSTHVVWCLHFPLHSLLTTSRVGYNICITLFPNNQGEEKIKKDFILETQKGSPKSLKTKYLLLAK